MLNDNFQRLKLGYCTITFTDRKVYKTLDIRPNGERPDREIAKLKRLKVRNKEKIVN